MNVKSFARKAGRKLLVPGLFLIILLLAMPRISSAHCDSYDGPLIKDALKAINEGKPDLVLKWIDKEHEPEIVSLFNKTIGLKGSDKEIFAIVEKHFLETLVRLHREAEGAPFTGLKPAGSTKPIITMADNALLNQNIEELSDKVMAHFKQVLNEKFASVMEKSRHKEESAAQGREFVAAYVDYTHFLEAIHDIIEHGSAGHGHEH